MPDENDTTTTPATPTAETKPMEGPKPARVTKFVPPPEPARGASTPTPPIGAWRFVIDNAEREVTVARRAIGSVAATFDGHEATAEADDIAVNLLARRLRKAGRDVVVLAPGAVRR